MANKEPKKETWKSYVFLLAFLAIGLFSLLYWGAPNEKFYEEQKQFREDFESGETLTDEEKNSEAVRVTNRYVAAIQNGVCSQVIGLSWWMQERLTHERQNAESTADDGATLNELCESITPQTSQRPRLGPEGIEDAYIFVQMAEVRAVRLDAGRADLAKPVRGRVWLQVRYPVPTQAVHDENGKPIKSVLVAINISTDGYVLKAGVLGNLEIDFDSISYDW